jgi:hypothetical protein
MKAQEFVTGQLEENLHKWFKEKWVRFGPDGKIRGDCARGSEGEGKPKCLPQSKAHALGQKGRASAAARKRRQDPNPERSGKAINVNTKKKTSEGVTEEVNPKIFNDIINSLPMFGTKPVQIGDFMFDARTFIGGLGEPDAKGLQIRAYDPKKPKGQQLIGSVSFTVKTGKKGNSWLESDDTKVDEPYRGKGVAALMYTFAKSLGNDIKPSSYQSAAGSTMWKKWGKDAKHLATEAAGQANTKAAIYQTEVFGAKAYHSRCLEPGCDWESRRFDRVKQAQDAAKKHAQSHFKSGTSQGLVKEVLNTATTGVQWDTSDPEFVTANFTASNGVPYELSITAPFAGPDEISPHDLFGGDIPDDIYDNSRFVEFAVQSNSPYTKGKQGIEGTGSAAEVFGIVTNALLQYTKKYKPAMLYFQAAEPSRQKLYAAIANRILKSLPGWAAKQQDQSHFVIYNQPLLKKQGVAEACWKGYHKEGMKTMFGKRYPNCVKNSNTTEDTIQEFIEETLSQKNSDEIRRIQQMLNKKFQANLDVDGVLGPLTKKSILQFLPSADTASAPDPDRGTRVQGLKQKATEEQCPECGGPMFSEMLMMEKKDACYYKVKSRYKVWPSAYASGALVRCRKKGAKNWGNKSK